MLNNYDKIAGSYDFLSRLIFHKAQVNAQTDQLSLLPAKSKILIAGGGTGWILQEIVKRKPTGIEITYVEISKKMIALARKRDVKQLKLQYINCAIEDYNTAERFDVIHTAFLFDNFAKERAEQVFNKLNTFLKPGGLWLFTDFYTGSQNAKQWKGFLLRMMYAFFNKIAEVEAKELVNTEVFFDLKNYGRLREKTYYRHFIKAIVYQKVHHTEIKNGQA
jgi:ubiquinone/menaquinone biosynthesis C-methylase UbiE